MSNFALIKIPTIVGQTTFEGYKDNLEVLSYSHGVAMQVTHGVSNSERTAGRPNFQDFTITRYSDSATPQLMQACAGGTTLKGDTVFTIARNDESAAVLPLIVITLANVVITSISMSGGGDMPVETVTLNFTHMKLDYTVQKAEGGKEGVTPFVFNLATNKAA
ncbi:MAG: type VI secretion system tube protein Hcp [Variovorax sp.]